MKEYEVDIYETVRHTTVVEAKSRKEALEKAYDKITNGSPEEYDTESEGLTGHGIEEL